MVGRLAVGATEGALLACFATTCVARASVNGRFALSRTFTAIRFLLGSYASPTSRRRMPFDGQTEPLAQQIPTPCRWRKGGGPDRFRRAGATHTTAVVTSTDQPRRTADAVPRKWLRLVGFRFTMSPMIMLLICILPAIALVEFLLVRLVRRSPTRRGKTVWTSLASVLPVLWVVVLAPNLTNTRQSIC